MCKPSSSALTESPFEEVKRLTGPYTHENVSSAQCSHCGAPALYYAADVYDDFWQHWCTLNAEDQALLAQEREDDEQHAILAREILGRSPYLVRGPVRGFEWVPAGHPPIEGPPW
jgi:hypothetical protein